MSLYGYKPKTRKALWFKPEAPAKRPFSSIKRKEPQFVKRSPIKRVSKSKANSDRIYNARVNVWIVGKRCAVFPHFPATQCHHRFGRRGRLKLWEHGWLPVSTQGHDKINREPEWAIAQGFVGPLGTWNDFERAVQHEEKRRIDNLRNAIDAYQKHHEKGLS